MRILIEKLKKRTKKAILYNLEKLIRKYGFDETRLVINKYFERIKEHKKLQEEVALREREIVRIKRRLVI